MKPSVRYSPDHRSGSVPSAAKRLVAPRPIEVQAAPGGVPHVVAGVEVEAVREDWVVEDRWWTGKPVRRRYFELVLADGRDVTIFCELGRRSWFAQRA